MDGIVGAVAQRNGVRLEEGRRRGVASDKYVGFRTACIKASRAT
ncbi:hypothetical protein BIFGAL_04018 [Bifidobacterium gallicum DSM 20093 = LMG 11596]|uniref:Uncharacterized protein n=1 Tax=Bifidobacterium gallicum DSM 20093 = LMG 11596 TaxID=561180 RepID=D1NVX4_9BIFI|nr:hypothetical protein BIFGAL_04018 [Bifidobacterium gallicum DSM 20093 = LMG 11596]